MSRTHCCICCSDHLTDIGVDFSLPVFQGVVSRSSPVAEDRILPLDWHVCENCDTVQIVNLPRIEDVYMSGHATGLGASWDGHHRAFADFIARSASDGTKLLDVGGGNLVLVSHLRRTGRHFDLAVLDPNPRTDSDYKAYRGFLDAAFIATNDHDTFIFSHVFEHLYAPRDILDRLDSSASGPHAIYLAWPSFEDWIESGISGAINFEHNFFASSANLEALFSQYGYRCIESEYYPHNMCRFYRFERARTTPILPFSRFRRNRSAVVRFYSELKRKAGLINECLHHVSKPTFLAPASVYAQSLIHAGLDPSRLSGLLDASPGKIGRRLYGTGLTVFSPEQVLRSGVAPNVVLNAGFHNDEIRNGYLALNKDVSFIEI